MSKLLSMLSLLLCSLIASFSPYKVAGVLKRWDQKQREKEKAQDARRKAGPGSHSNGDAVTYEKNGTVKTMSHSDSRASHLSSVEDKTVPKSERIISMMITFSGGVLLAVALVHMLPEVRTDILHGMALGKIIHTKLPLSEMIFCAGFLAVYFIERFVRFMVKRKDDRQLKKITVAIQPSVLPMGTSESGLVYNAPNNAHILDNKSIQANDSLADLEAAKADHETLGKKLGHFFIILALSFHSIFEGLAIGLQSTSESVWLLFLGVGTHKFLIAFCIGMEMFTSGHQSIKMASGYLITFAVMSPIGIAMGIGVTEEISNDPGTQAAVVGVLQGLAGGTLLYVTFFELLNEQSEKVKSMPAIYSFMEWLMFALGFVAMTTIDSAASAADPTQNTTLPPHFT